MAQVNRSTARRALGFLVLIALVAASVIPATAQRRRTRRNLRLGRYTRSVKAQPTYLTVAANTVIRVRMNEEISSRNARVGDRFSTNVTEPAYAAGGVEVIPVGSRVWGRVTSVRRAGRRTPGSITVSFNQVELPNGMSRSINGSLTSLQADDVNADNEGTVKGRGNRKRDAVFIGGGAATGALIGAIAGGGKGAGIGAIIGGGLGTAGRVFERERDAEVKSGTEFGVILNQRLSLPEYGAR
jgi:HAMP domain-containing protein